MLPQGWRRQGAQTQLTPGKAGALRVPGRGWGSGTGGFETTGVLPSAPACGHVSFLAGIPVRCELPHPSSFSEPEIPAARSFGRKIELELVIPGTGRAARPAAAALAGRGQSPGPGRSIGIARSQWLAAARAADPLTSHFQVEEIVTHHPAAPALSCTLVLGPVKDRCGRGAVALVRSALASVCWGLCFSAVVWSGGLSCPRAGGLIGSWSSGRGALANQYQLGFPG